VEAFLPWAQEYGYLAIFVVLLGAGLGVPIPEDIPLLTGGWLCHRGVLNVWLVFLVSMVGVMVGDSLIFMAGRKTGSAINRLAFLKRHVGGKRKARVDRYFERYGNWTVFFGRFVAGLRAPTFFTAGASGMHFRTFFVYDCVAALVSVPVWIALAYFLGDEIDGVLAWMASAKQTVLIVLACLVPLVVAWWLIRRRRRASAGEPATDASDEPPPPEQPPTAPSAEA